MVMMGIGTCRLASDKRVHLGSWLGAAERALRIGKAAVQHDWISTS